MPASRAVVRTSFIRVLERGPLLLVQDAHVEVFRIVGVGEGRRAVGHVVVGGDLSSVFAYEVELLLPPVGDAGAVDLDEGETGPGDGLSDHVGQVPQVAREALSHEGDTVGQAPC